ARRQLLASDPLPAKGDSVTKAMAAPLPRAARGTTPHGRAPPGPKPLNVLAASPYPPELLSRYRQDCWTTLSGPRASSMLTASIVTAAAWSVPLASRLGPRGAHLSSATLPPWWTSFGGRAPLVAPIERPTPCAL